MIPKEFRAPKVNIEETLKKGETLISPLFLAKISRKNGEKPLFAVIISKKTEKTSVGRHLIKRRINAVLEDNLKKINPDFKKTVVFMVKKQEKSILYKEIKKQTEFVLGKMKVILFS